LQIIFYNIVCLAAASIIIVFTPPLGRHSRNN
jgi:hypothetical protein